MNFVFFIRHERFNIYASQPNIIILTNAMIPKDILDTDDPRKARLSQKMATDDERRRPRTEGEAR